MRRRYWDSSLVESVTRWPVTLEDGASSSIGFFLYFIEFFDFIVHVEYRCHVFVRSDSLACVVIADHDYPPRVCFTLMNKVGLGGGREGRGGEGKRGKGREGKGREGKGREGKGRGRKERG